MNSLQQKHIQKKLPGETKKSHSSQSQLKKARKKLKSLENPTRHEKLFQKGEGRKDLNDIFSSGNL
uniref:Uncharacterized protein n=1 Tax=Nelumbo nucifera TaxID=4432 RepID=A0A822YHQ8_NELNU|nr:TPA_asm: hypothetical protein HUJ06_010515 [Nelumbo nucifera]